MEIILINYTAQFSVSHKRNMIYKVAPKVRINSTIVKGYSMSENKIVCKEEIGEHI